MGFLPNMSKHRKVADVASSSFLPTDEFPVNSPEVIQHVRAAVGRYASSRHHLYLFFDVESIGALPDIVPWKQWQVDHVPEEHLPEYPHMLQFSVTLCDDHQNLVAARNYLVRPDGFVVPPVAQEVHGTTQEQALEKGVPVQDILREFSDFLGPTTRVVTFEAAVDAVVLEVELRRCGLPLRLPRDFFFDLSEKTREFCAIPDEDDEEKFAKPHLKDVYDRLFQPFDIDWHNAAADVQALQHCFFALTKRGVL